MKYIITKTQLRNNIDYLKEPMFRYWDSKGPKDLEMARQLFGLPPGASTLVEEWLLEWMGGKDEVDKKLEKYTSKIFNAQSGTYNFNFYLKDVRIYVHDGIEIYFDAVVDGDGKVHIEYPNYIIDNLYKANMDENIGWEVETEIRDTIIESLEDIIDIEFPIRIDGVSITEPGMFHND